MDTDSVSQNMKPKRYFPAEWERQSGVMLTWPHAHSDWATLLDTVEAVFVQIAQAISASEKLLIIAYDESHQTHISRLLKEARVDPAQLFISVQCSNDTWARDHAAITIMENDRPLLLDFVFNGWGNKYPADKDTLINQGLNTQQLFHEVPMHSVDFVLEGGSIETDGNGCLLTTTACLLSSTRNPGYSRQQIETKLKHELGVEKILWLENGYLAGDDTDSHIDMLARFCDGHTIAFSQCNDPADEHFTALQAMQNELAGFTNTEGKPYKLVGLPIPAAIYDDAGQRLPASYANFLIINGAVLMPVYKDPADALALQKLHACFAEREIIAVPARDLIRQYGGVHCLTMQFPAGVL